jgi:predicted RNA-binding protein YlqC (UPF0109 family)
MSTIDQQFIEYIVKSLVSKPDAVVIDRRVDEKGVLLELHVDSEDLGRVIGKRGATAQSLRTLLRALGTKQDARLNLKIIDPNQPERDYNNSYEAGSSNDHGHREENEQRNDSPVAVEETTVEETIPTPVVEAKPEPEPEEDNSHSERLSQTRRELAEFDDLDV